MDTVEVEWSLPGTGWKEKWEFIFNGTEFQLGKMKKVLETDGGDGTNVSTPHTAELYTQKRLT